MKPFDDEDMRAYSEQPGLLDQVASSQQAQPVHQMMPSPDAAEPDFGDLGIDTNAQLLEAILSELRSINQALRELA